MKRIYLLLLSLVLSGLSNYTFADYPLVSYRYLADPGAFVYNGRVYVYCSNDDDNGDSSYDMHTIVCVSSSDLKNWTDHGVVFNVPRDASWSNLSWAPSPAYRDGKFYLYFGNGGSAIGVAVADNPLGPFVDPIGRNLVSGSTSGVQPSTNMWLFDPMTFVDDDGQAYMYFGGNGDDNLRVIRLNDDMTSINGAAERFNVPDFFEAAWMHKHNGTYYFSYSSNPSAGMRIDYMTSNNPMSGFTYKGSISLQPPVNNNNNHHSTIKLGDDWYEIYHNRIVASENGHNMPYHRNLAVDKFSHNQDGSIVQMVNTVDGVQQRMYLDPYVRVEAETMSEHNGIETEVCSEGGMNVAYIDNNDWVMVEGVDFGSAGAGSFSANVASDKTGGTIEIRLGSSNGTLIGTLPVPNTGDFQNWQTEITSVNQATGVHNVYFVFKGGSSSLFNFDHWSFYSSGPIVNISSPAISDILFGGDDITIEASAEAQEGSITKVEFFVDGQSVGIDNTAPYSFTHNNISEGAHIITVVATDTQNEEGSKEITITVNIPQGPYGGVAHPIPGTIQVENYDVGGNGFAYYDDSEGSETGVDFRTDEDVDVEACTDTDGGYNLGWATSGEWLEYTVDVQASGSYNIEFRVACNGDDRTVSLDMNEQTIVNNVAIPNTGDWQGWQTVTVNNVELIEGEQVLRMTVGSEDYLNINYVKFTGVVTALLSEEETGVQLHPNPFTNNGVTIKTAGTFSYEITDVSGLSLEAGKGLEEGAVGVNLPLGIYFLIVENQKGKFTYKIVKQ